MRVLDRSQEPAQFIALISRQRRRNIDDTAYVLGPLGVPRPGFERKPQLLTC